MMRWAENIDETAWSTHFKPVVEYFVTFAELVALTALFNVASDRSDSLLLSAVSIILKYICGIYVGLPAGLMVMKLNRFKTKSLSLALAIGVPLGLLVGIGSSLISLEMSRAVDNLAKVSGSD